MKRAKVTITYNSYHDGYVQYYKTLKSINPDIMVGAEHGSEEFLQAMGTEYPFDCLDTHPLGSGYPSNLELPEAEFLKQSFLVSQRQVAELSALQNAIKKSSGKEFPLQIKAYGHAQNNMSKQSSKSSHLNLAEGLNEASLLIAYQNLGIKVAHRFLLNDTPFNPDVSDAPTARRFNAAIISNGEDDTFVATPVGLAIGIMSKLGGKTRVRTDVRNNPSVAVDASPEKFYDSLNTIAAVDAAGNLDLVVVNQNLDNDVEANVVLPGYKNKKIATVTTMNGPSATAINDLVNVNVVTNTTVAVSVAAGRFAYSFPAHSITKISLQVE